MFYYIKQPHNLSFPIGSFPLGWLKLNLILLLDQLRLAQGDECWWQLWLVLMFIFFWISQTWPVTLRIQEYVFSGYTVPPDSKETKLGNSKQAASPSAGKDTRIDLVPCHTRKCILTAISSGVGISNVHGCRLFWQMSSQW